MHCVSTNLPSANRASFRVTTADVACYHLQSAVYDAVKATAGLDTQRGHNAMAKAYAWDGVCEIAIAVGSFMVKGSSYDLATGERR